MFLLIVDNIYRLFLIKKESTYPIYSSAAAVKSKIRKKSSVKKTAEKVNVFHQIALNNGGTNEGLPGPRHGENCYAYIRDIDGNKICAFASTSAI